jgi:phospholipase/carboxylesterase
MSASVALSAPRHLTGFAVLSGRILPEIEPHIVPAEELSHLDAFVAHGRGDDKLPPAWADRADRWLSELGVRHRTRFYPFGHELGADEVVDFNAWLAEALALG